MRRLLTVCACALLMMTTVRADDWPQFRGPTAQGHATATGLPTEFGPSQNVVWKRAIPGSGWSSPVLHQGKLYLTTAVPAGSGGNMSLRAFCLDAKTGKPVWDTELFTQDGRTSPRPHRKNSHASPTPLIHDDKLYVHFGHQGTACLTLDGKVVWRQQIKYPPVHGNGGSPVVVDDVLFFSCDAARNPFVIALDVKTGKERWRTPRDTEVRRKFSFSTPLVIEVEGRKQIVSPGSGAVVAYDPKSGKPIWKARYGEGYSVVPRPVYAHGLVFVSSGFDRPVLLAIKPTGKGDVTDTHVAWQMTKGAPHTPSMLVVGDELYCFADRGMATCVDAKTGEEHWQERIGGAYSASPVFADGRIYITNEQGKTVVLKPGKSFEVLAENDLKQKTLATLAVGDGAIFLRTESHLYCFAK